MLGNKMKHPRMWSKTRWVLSILALVILGTGIYVGARLYDSYTNVKVLDAGELVPDMVGEPGDQEQPDLSDNNKDMNILVMGSDEREEGSDITGMRSDTTVIMNISGDRKKITGFSIPRDSWVDIPSCKRRDGTKTAPTVGKFNKAFALGGANGDLTSAAACTITTVQSLTKIKIDGYVVVDMSGFVDIVDAMGGVEMTIDQDIDSPKANLELKAGKQNLNGKQALGYARARSGVGMDGSDLSRIGRQQELFQAIMTKAKSKVTDPLTMLNTLNATSRMVHVSPSLKPEKIAGLAWNAKSADIKFIQLPVTDRGDGANVLWTQEAYNIFKKFKKDGYSQSK